MHYIVGFLFRHLFDLNTLRTGFLPTDLEEFCISSSCMKLHSDQDRKKMIELSRREYLDPEADNEELSFQLETMWNVGRNGAISLINFGEVSGEFKRDHLSVFGQIWLLL